MTTTVATTKPMNHSQRLYAIERVKEISRQLRNKAEEKYKTIFTLGELVKGIKNGSIKLDKKPDYEISRYTDVNDVFKIDVGKANHKLAKVAEDIYVLEQQAKDAIMLGDCDAGLAIIAKLESYKI